MKTITKKDCLLKWCQWKKVFSGVDVRKWGVENYYICADRKVREFAEKGLVKRIPDLEASLRGLNKEQNTKIAWYEC
jgi:hypothetical protein